MLMFAVIEPFFLVPIFWPSAFCQRRWRPSSGRVYDAFGCRPPPSGRSADASWWMGWIGQARVLRCFRIPYSI